MRNREVKRLDHTDSEMKSVGWRQFSEANDGTAERVTDRDEKERIAS